MEITPPRVWRRRRDWLRAGLSTMVGGVGLGPAGRASARPADQAEASATAGSGARQRLPARMGDAAFQTMEKPTAAGDVTSYNNFYEFGTDKRDPQRHASRMVVRPWTVSVEGLVRRPRVFDLDELLSLAPMEERVYRLRCVEGWSMVIPWIGYSLAELIRRVEPLGDAKFIEYQTLADRRQMPGLDYPVLDWPYTEGLRLDEAMHPLTLLTFGMYGEVLPNQNGAPVRVIVPWKYGFKSGKSIVRIRFTDRQPMTTWHQHAPRVYGFYANVNPEVDHPRWSQTSERRIGDDGLFARKRRTLMFNGYADQVASLYQGMDLTRHI